MVQGCVSTLKPDYLVRILNNEELRFIAGRIVKSEVGSSPNYESIKSIFESNVSEFRYYEYGEILRPFFSTEEIRKGEHEVIAISYILHFLGIYFIMILDDDQSRKFVEGNFPELARNMMGTVGFVGECCCSYNIFSKEEAITILMLIDKSKFRIRKETIEEIVEKIEGC